MIFTLVCKFAFFLVLTLKALSMPLTGPQINLHPSVFEDSYYNVTPTDVGAFKFYCIQDYILSMIEEYIPIFAFADLLSNDTEFTTICKEYSDIKTYQVMLNQSLDCQSTANVSNTTDVSNGTILSILYLLQQARESLQEIQYDKHQIYCPDDDYEEIQMCTCVNQTEIINSVFRTLYAKNNDQWSTRYYSDEAHFNASPHIQYRNGNCDHYMKLYTTLTMSIY